MIGRQFRAPGFWFLVLGAAVLVLGSRFAAQQPASPGHGSSPTVAGLQMIPLVAGIMTGAVET